jgi:hypothetical protein
MVLLGLAFSPTIFFFGRNFEYEYALFLSWMIVLVIPTIALIIPNMILPNSGVGELPPTPTRSVLGKQTRGMLLYGVLLPLVLFFTGYVSFSNGTCQCSLNGYLFWMTILVLPSYLLALSIHFLLFHLARSGVPRIKLFGRYAALVVLQLTLLAAILWFFPQKRSVSLFFGFLHGPVYDAWIHVDYGVILSRVGVVFFALGIYFYGRRLRVQDPNKFLLTRPVKVTACLFLVAWVGSWMAPSGLHGTKPLKKFLSKQIKSKSVNVFFRETSQTSIERMRLLAKEAEFHTEDLARFFKLTITKPIPIFVYSSDDEKKIYFGGGSTDVTDVWGPSVHITVEDTPHGSLRHELVHAVASRFGWYGLGFHPNMAITEGLAVMLAPYPDRYGYHAQSALLVRQGKIKNLEELFSPWVFWSYSGAQAYTVAGSFLDFLRFQTSSDALRKIYSGSSVESATGQSVQHWALKWRAYVDSQYDPGLELQSESLYRDVGVLHDRCPHTKADYQKPRSRGVLSTLRQPLGWHDTDYLNWRVAFDAKDRSALVEQWRKRIREAVESRQVTPLALSAWLEALSVIIHSPAKSVEDIELSILKSDLLALGRKFKDSSSILQDLLRQSSVQPPGENIERQILARIILSEAKLVPSQYLEWRRFLAGWRGVPLEEESEHWIQTYLRLRRDKRTSLDVTKSYTIVPVDEMDPRFRLEWHRILGARFLALNEFSLAARQYQVAEVLAKGDAKAYYTTLQRFSSWAEYRYRKAGVSQ